MYLLDTVYVPGGHHLLNAAAAPLLPQQTITAKKYKQNKRKNGRTSIIHLQILYIQLISVPFVLHSIEQESLSDHDKMRAQFIHPNMLGH